MDSLRYFSREQMRMIDLACRMRSYAIQHRRQLPGFKDLVDQWYLTISPAIPLYSALMVFDWLTEMGFYAEVN